MRRIIGTIVLRPDPTVNRKGCTRMDATRYLRYLEYTHGGRVARVERTFRWLRLWVNVRMGRYYAYREQCDRRSLFRSENRISLTWDGPRAILRGGEGLNYVIKVILQYYLFIIKDNRSVYKNKNY